VLAIQGLTPFSLPGHFVPSTSSENRSVVVLVRNWETVYLNLPESLILGVAFQRMLISKIRYFLLGAIHTQG
jgi:hypothetical protein